MEKVRPLCGQPWNRGWLKNGTDAVFTYLSLNATTNHDSSAEHNSQQQKHTSLNRTQSFQYFVITAAEKKLEQ